MKAKPVLERAADALGYRLVAKWRAPGLPQAEKLRQVFDRHAISAVLDVGANEGQFRDFLRLEVGFSGTIHSFEPISSLAAKMQARRGSDALWHVHNFALGREQQLRELNIMASSKLTSFLVPRHDLVTQFASANTIERTQEVSVRTLDTVVPSLGLDLPRTFLKIDTQGYDHEVARGGQNTLAQVNALQTEVCVRPIYEGMPTLAQSLALFSDLGFHPADFSLISADEHLRAIEFDCIMVRG